jgi:hypothetical protein
MQQIVYKEGDDKPTLVIDSPTVNYLELKNKLKVDDTEASKYKVAIVKNEHISEIWNLELTAKYSVGRQRQLHKFLTL